MSINSITGISEWNVVERSSGDADCPAPTLQEILAAMKHLSISLGFSIHPSDWRWYIYANDQKSNDGTRIREEDHDNPATAALKLWLEIMKEEK